MPSSPAAPVRVHVLGTVQDGGVPQSGCVCPRCEAARRGTTKRRLIASIGVSGASGCTFLVDATPDLREQADALRAAAGKGATFVDAIALTHAHTGHYVGLAFLGKEGMHAQGMPVYATPKMARYVEKNRPWAHLVEREEIELRTLAPGRPLAFDGAMIHAFLSPHRSEDTDTIGFEIRGPTRRLIYASDTDFLPPALVERIREADVALIDGTFYDRSELPDREILEVKHPYVKESVVALAGGKGHVYFTHLNHTNPLLDPDSAASRSLPPGFSVAVEGMSFDL